MELSASERYQDLVRYRLNKVSNEAVNKGAELRKKEVRKGNDRYIREVKTPERCTLRLTDGMCESFRWHFESPFTKKPGLCGGRSLTGIEECRGPDGIIYELYLSLSHIFLPIFIIVFKIDSGRASPIGLPGV